MKFIVYKGKKYSWILMHFLRVLVTIFEPKIRGDLESLNLKYLKFILDIQSIVSLNESISYVYRIITPRKE